MNTYSYKGAPAMIRLVAHLLLVASALFVATELSAQPIPSSSRIELSNSFTTIASQDFSSENNVDATDESYTVHHAPAGEVSVSDIGVVGKRNLVYVTLEATDDVVASIDVYSMNGSHVGRPIDQMNFARGKQRFGVDLPSGMRPGTYLLKISTPRGIISRSFALAR